MPTGFYNNTLRDTASWVKRNPCDVCLIPVPASHRSRHICPGRPLSDFESACFEYWKSKRQRVESMLRNRDPDGPRFYLTLDNVITLFENAGIHPSQVGRKRGTYNLCRFGDTGDYVMGNCRFALWEENRREELALREIRKASDPEYRNFIYTQNVKGAAKRQKL